jgi:signal transduction histidine kinase
MYSILPTISAVLFLLMGIWVLFNNKKNAINIALFLLCLTTFFWQASWAFLFQVSDPIKANLIIKIGYSFIIFLPTFMYHFLIQASESKKDKSWLKLSYIISIILFLIHISTNLFVNGQYEYFWGYYPKASYFHPIHVIQTFSTVLRGVYIAIKRLGKTQYPLNEPISYAAVGLVIYCFAAIDYLCNYGFEFYPPGVIFILLYLAILTYAITQKNLINVKVAISRWGAFVLTALFFGLGYITLLITYRIAINNTLDVFFSALSFVYVVFGVGPYFTKVEAALRKHAHEKFLNIQSDIHQTLLKVSESLIFAQSTDDVIQSVLTVQNSLEIGNCYALLRMSQDRYSWAMLGQEKKEILQLPSNEAVVHALQNAQKLSKVSELPKDVIRFFHQYQIHKNSVCLIIHSFRELHAVIVMGQKLTEDSFTDIEMSWFETILNQAINVFERIGNQERLLIANQEKETLNQKLHLSNQDLKVALAAETELKEKALQVAKELSHQAKLSKLAAGISHEIRNPLSIIQGDMYFVAGKFGGKQFTVEGTEQLPTPERYWIFELSADYFLSAVNNDPALANAVISWLIDDEYITPDGRFTEKFDPVEMKTHRIQVPDPLLPFREEILKRFAHARLLDTLHEFFSTASAQFSRIIQITSNMMKYGMSAGGVQKDTFMKLSQISEEDSAAIYTEIKNLGYIDMYGCITEKFEHQNPEFKLSLSDKFKDRAAEILYQIRTTPGAIKAPMDINKVIQNSVSIFTAQTRRDAVKLTLNLEPDLDPIMGDDLRMQQAIFNILFNAFQAFGKDVNSENCEIQITTQSRTFIGHQGLRIPGIDIFIQDNGPGIDPDHLNKIFNPFFTTKSPTSGQNAGLGLSIVRDVILNHGGFIYVYSDLGEGAKFKMTLPTRSA